MFVFLSFVLDRLSGAQGLPGPPGPPGEGGKPGDQVRKSLCVNNGVLLCPEVLRDSAVIFRTYRSFPSLYKTGLVVPIFQQCFPTEHHLPSLCLSGRSRRGRSRRRHGTQSKLTHTGCFFGIERAVRRDADCLRPCSGGARIPRRERSRRPPGSAGTQRPAWNSRNRRTQGEATISSANDGL